MNRGRSIPGRRSARKRNPQKKSIIVEIYPVLMRRIVTKAEERASSEGVMYLSTLVNLLLGLYARGRVSGGFRREFQTLVGGYFGARKTSGVQTCKKHLKVLRSARDSAARRWSSETRSRDTTESDMIRFLLWAYSTGKIELSLRARGEDAA